MKPRPFPTFRSPIAKAPALLAAVLVLLLLLSSACSWVYTREFRTDHTDSAVTAGGWQIHPDVFAYRYVYDEFGPPLVDEFKARLRATHPRPEGSAAMTDLTFDTLHIELLPSRDLYHLPLRTASVASHFREDHVKKFFYVTDPHSTLKLIIPSEVDSARIWFRALLSPATLTVTAERPPATRQDSLAVPAAANVDTSLVSLMIYRSEFMTKAPGTEGGW